MTKGLDAQQKIFAGNPDDRRAFEALEEHFFLDGDWPALVRVYRARLAAPSIESDPVQKGALLFRLAQILEERVVDLDAAAESYWALARLDSSNRAALRQLRGIHERRGQFDMVLQIAEIESASTMPPYERARFEADLGRIWHRHLGDRAEAERAYQRALAIDAALPEALEGLSALCLEAGRTADAARHLEALTARLRGPERAPFWLALGRLQAIEAGDRDRARASFAAALDDDPLLTAAVEWSLLLATEAEDWPAVAGLLEHRFDLASGARHRAAVAVEASQIHLQQCHSSASARAWIERASELAPDDGAVLRARADVARAEGDDDALVRVLERLIAQAGPRASRALRLELAESLARRGRAADALRTLEAIPGDDAGDDLRRLELRASLLRATNAKRELAEVLETLVAIGSTDASDPRGALRSELARLYEEDLADPASAELHWQAAFEHAPHDEEAFCALERIHRKRDDWSALRILYETAIAAAGSTTPAARSAELGRILLDRFDDPQSARSWFERTLAAEAHHEAALAGLRRIGERTHDAGLLLAVCEREAEGCDDPRAFCEIAERAIALLVARSADEEALGWAVRADERMPTARAILAMRAELEGRLGSVDAELDTRTRLAPLLPDDERSRCLQQCAALQLAKGELPDAAASLEQSHRAAPHRVEILESLIDVHRQLDHTQEQVRWLRLLAERLPEARRAGALDRLACLLQDPIGDLEAAIAVRRQLIELPEAPREAIPALEALLELTGRHGELAALLEQERRKLADNCDEARALDLRRGRLLLDALGDCESAATIFAALHARDPQDETLLGLLERALRAGHDATGLCDLLARRATWETRAEKRAPLLFERAQLLEEVLGQPHAACDGYTSVLELVPGTPLADDAHARLEALTEATGQWARLRTLLGERIERSAEPERSELRLRLAEICRDQLQDPAGCARELEAVAQLHPDRIHLWQQLQDLYTRVLDRPGDWLRVARAELGNLPTPARELVLRVSIGRLLLDPKRRPPTSRADDAFEHYERAFSLDPTHAEAAEVLVHHFERFGSPIDVARILETHASRLGPSRADERCALELRLATVFSRDLSDDARARPLLERARALRGAVPEVAEPLAALLERAADPDSLARLGELARETIRLLRRERERLPWRIRLGRACAGTGRIDDAIEAYRAALVEAPGDHTIEDALQVLYEQQGDRTSLIELLERRLAFASAEAEISLRLRLSELHAEEPEGAPRALAHLEAILDRIPHHRDALDRALALAARVGDPVRTRRLLDRALALPLSASDRADRLEARGLLPCAPDDATGIARAIDDLREALVHDPARKRARVALRARLETLERWPAVLDCLGVEAALERGEARCALLEEGATTALARIGPDAALPWLARLRAERPHDPSLWQRLAAIQLEAGRPEAALRALDEEFTLRTTREERLAVLRQRARLFEDVLESPGRAVLAYRAALELSSDRGPILFELDRLLAQLGRPLERASILEARVAALPGRSGLELRRTLAELYCAALAKPESAVVHLRANVEATRDDPAEELHHLGALAAALRACNREEEWAAVADRELILIASDPALAARTPIEYQRFLREEIARILDELLGDSERALERIRELCDDPALAADGVSLRIQSRLHDLLRRTGRPAELTDRLARYSAAGHATPREWLELASLREGQACELDLAVEAYREAERDPALRLEALRGRRRCAVRLCDHEGVALALREELDFEPALPRADRTALALHLGELAWRRLSSAERANAAYQIALELDPRNTTALYARIEISESISAREETLSLLRRAVELETEENESRSRRAALWRRIAGLHASVDPEIPAALAAYREAEALERLPAGDERAYALLCERAGESEAFATLFARWCDREDGGSAASDHLRLAGLLAERGRLEAALARAERAVALAPEDASAWAGLADHQRASGRLEPAIESLERAAGHALPIEAARHLALAGELAEPLDPERAHALFDRAVGRDAACFGAHAGLTRVSSRLGRPADTLRHAELALELASGRSISDATRLELALLGGRAASAAERGDAALRLFGAALALAPDHAEALDGVADAHFANGDLIAAKGILERRLAQDEPGPHRARQLSMLGRALEAEGRLDEAAARQREALALDPAFDGAHEGLARALERAAEPHAARAALAAWAQQSRDPGSRARAALRAGEHALAAGEWPEARRLLEHAVEEDRELGEAWVLACELVAREGSQSEVRLLCERALAACPPGVHSARIAARLARLDEIEGRRDAAVARYGEAWSWDPRCSEAALCQSRLARMAGDWLEADSILSRFLAAHPDPTSASLAQVHLERGRLLSGPLEGFDQAIAAYRRALELQPGLAVAKSALAGLLLHAPDAWREALALHREILRAAPTTATSIRALGTLAERQGRPEASATVGCLLAALGIASEPESLSAPRSLALPLHAGSTLATPATEHLRRLAHLLRTELARILPEPAARPADASDASVEAAIDALLAIEDELAAPGLTRLPEQERRGVFLAIGGLFLDPGGNGGDPRVRDALDRALGLWTRRRVRRMVEETSLAALESVDHGLFLTELRLLAAASLLDRQGAELRSVLLALVALDPEIGPADEPRASEVGGLVSSCEVARRLLVRICETVCEKLERGR